MTLSWKPGTLLAPVPPALVSCGSVENPNVLTVAWTGIVCTRPAMTYISLRPERFSHPIIKETGEFVINLTTVALIKAADFCGVRSGRDVDKFALCSLTPKAASGVDAPRIEESPLSLSCRVVETKELGSHDMFLSEIVAVDVDERFVDKEGKLCLEKANLLAYAHGTYYALGGALGTFGCSVRKKPVKGRGRKPGVRNPAPKAKSKER